MALLRKFQNGGTNTTIPVGSKPIQVYENGEGWDNYKKYETANNAYTANQGYHKEMANQGYTDATPVTSAQIANRGRGFTPVEGTSYVRYKAGNANVPAGFGDNFFTESDTGYTYVPQVAKPEGNYEVMENPEIAKQKQQQADWKAANEKAGIKGYKKVPYSAGGGRWDYELVPIRGNQAIPNDGTFMEYNRVGGDDIYKIVGGAPKLKDGGLLMVSSFKKGGILYNTKKLVAFGNYLLSKDRKKMVSKNMRDAVGHWDLENWKEKDKDDA